MDQKLTHAPLVEAIIEIRWKLDEPQPGLLVDPQYKILVGRLYDRLVDNYPFHEPLPTASMPDEILPYAIQHRFRVETGKWPLVQVGPGIVTLNDTENYSWDNDFEQRASKLMTTLFEAYPKAKKSLKISGIQLKYIDAIDFNFSNENIFLFMQDKLKTTLSFPDELFKDSPIKSLPAGINTLFAFPITNPLGNLSLRFANGTHNQAEALIWETVVQSKESELPEMPGKFKNWLDSAHNLTHNMFFKLIKGPLEEAFKMIGTLEHSTSTYDAKKLPADNIRNLYASRSTAIGNSNSTVILYDLLDESFDNPIDFVITSGSYHFFPFWNLPVATATFVTHQKLSLKQAQDLALKALASAEEKRQREREAEAKYWFDLE